jgi:osmotically-inducible protein OsmY
MQTKTIQRLGLVVLLAGASACNKSDAEHEQSAATSSGEERAEVSESEAQAAVTPHQTEPEAERRERAERVRDRDAEANEADRVASDNTGRNKRDQEGETITPMDQGESESDLEITRRIREAMVGNDALSFMAKNAKVITVNGRVTLRGPVHSEDERELIEAAARSVVGANQVVSQLEVK